MSLTELAISGPLLLAALVALAAGAVSFASPCCLPLVPGYLGYLAGLAGAQPPPVAARLRVMVLGCHVPRLGPPATKTRPRPPVPTCPTSP